ncbi:hypothetical protein [Stutzerimonas azotifigens]|uniref:hypothetical protein n=1 Tax=Stutzerimonas azotifigens TaxID=291995 RepID=UPI0003FC5F18|nr:hypothetical protein [Stutzerimonas azotifigens]
MLPTLPTGVLPATSPQQDVPKLRPEPPPVAPVQPGSGGDAVGLEQRRPEEAAERLREEQRRRRRQAYTPEQIAAGDIDEEDREALAELPRQGLWVDIEV